MQERPFDREQVKELLKDHPDIVLHGLGGTHYTVSPIAPAPTRPLLTPSGLTRRQLRKRLAR